MIRTGSNRTLTRTNEIEQQAKDLKRLLAKAEQHIRKLQEKIADQKQQMRGLQAQVRHEDGLAAEREELKAEIADLKGEIKELTRANRERVERLDALQLETGKLKAEAKARRTDRFNNEGAPCGSDQDAPTRALRLVSKNEAQNLATLIQRAR
jgi:septal ring factor EnvC (AmiA/AmiB activator)